MEKPFKISLYLLIMLGIIHISFTPVVYKSLSIDALWFMGSGLSYIFMGLYNLATLKVKIKSIYSIAVALNFIATVFTMAITYILREPHTFVALVLVIFIFLNSLFYKN